MPFLQLPAPIWQTVPCKPGATPYAVQEQRKTEQIDPVLKVEWQQKIIYPDDQKIEFRGSVRATFGPTVLECDTLILDQANSKGIASGNVVVSDPEGKAFADRLEFDWKNKAGAANNARIELPGMRLLVADLEIEAGTWKFRDARVASLVQDKPVFWFTARDMIIEPGKAATIADSGFRVGSSRIAGFPTVKLSLDRRINSLSIPTLSLRKRSGFGINWDMSRFLGTQTLMAGSFTSFPKLPPSYGLQFLRSFIDQESATALLIPRSELADRFADSWFDSITARSPDQQVRTNQSLRRTIGVGTFWNQSTRGRPENSDAITKRFEFISELGGPTPFGGITTQVRYQSIRPDFRTSYLQRAAVNLTAAPSPVRLGSALQLWIRGDAFATYSEGAFGWGRATVGLSVSPLPGLRIGAAGIIGGSAGTPNFGFDQLYSKFAFHARADWQIGSVRFGALSKYDLNQHRWYDHQLEFAVQIGVLEPYILYRQFPSDIRVGLQLRLDTLANRLKSREIKRL